jgi:transcriptional regulator GlxA family with amidase domain
MTLGRICIVAFDDVQLLDVAGPLEVFDLANFLAGRALYRVEVAALDEQVRTTSGLVMATRPLARISGPLDTLVVAGGMGTVNGPLEPGLVRQVRRLARISRRTASVCSGTFILAEAGLLEGKRVTTHWAAAKLLQNQYPSTTVDDDPIYIEDQGVWTSAGVTSGIDLALALVADDHGKALANDVARWLVLPGRRHGGQSQYSPHLAQSPEETADFAQLLEWLPDNLTEDLTVGALARRVNLSERHFARRFTRAVGTTPADHVEALRVDAARVLLETTDLDVASVGRRCGFASRETMHRAFARRLGVTPISHRRAFSH